MNFNFLVHRPPPSDGERVVRRQRMVALPVLMLKRLVDVFRLRTRGRDLNVRDMRRHHWMGLLEERWPADKEFPDSEAAAWRAIHQQTADEQRRQLDWIIHRPMFAPAAAQAQAQTQTGAGVAGPTTTPPTLAIAMPPPQVDDALEGDMARLALEPAVAAPAAGHGAPLNAADPDASPRLVLFDLDETLYHTSPSLTVTHENARLVQSVFTVEQYTVTVVHFFIGAELVHTALICEVTADGICSKFEIRVPESSLLALSLVRPGALQVVQRVCEMAHTTVGVWTASTRPYASALLRDLVRVVHANLEAGEPSRLQYCLTRRQCWLHDDGDYLKPLSRVFNFAHPDGAQWHPGNTLLVDNRPEVGRQFQANVLPVDDFQLAPAADGCETAALLRTQVAHLARASGWQATADAIADPATPVLFVDAVGLLDQHRNFITLLEHRMRERRSAHAALCPSSLPAFHVPDWTTADLDTANEE